MNKPRILSSNAGHTETDQKRWFPEVPEGQNLNPMLLLPLVSQWELRKLAGDSWTYLLRQMDTPYPGPGQVPRARYTQEEEWTQNLPLQSSFWHDSNPRKISTYILQVLLMACLRLAVSRACAQLYASSGSVNAQPPSSQQAGSMHPCSVHWELIPMCLGSSPHPHSLPTVYHQMNSLGLSGPKFPGP